MPGWRDQVLAATAAVHTADGTQLLGSAVLVDADRLLTCRHVVTTEGTPSGTVLASVSITLPGHASRRATPQDLAPTADAIVLELSQSGVEDAPQRDHMPAPVRIS